MIAWNQTDWISDKVLQKHLISTDNTNWYCWKLDDEHFRMNKVAWHFEDLEYLNTINIQYSEILANVTTRGSRKLYPKRQDVIDVRFGRSTKQIITNQFIITSHYQWTWIIIPSSIKCKPTELNGL